MNCQQTGIHTIKPGDSMYLIAQMHRMTLPDLMAMNPGVDPYNLQIGSQIIICRDQEMNHNSMNMPSGMNQTPTNMNQGSMNQTPCMNHHSANMAPCMNHHSMNRNPGMNQTPANMGSGMNQTPANMNPGMNQTPANMGSGMNQTPANMGSGANQTPANMGSGVNQTPANMGSGMNQTPANMGSGMNQTPTNMGPGMNQTPTNMGSGTNQTPTNMDSGINQTPTNMGPGMNQTPTNMDSGINQTPTNMGPGMDQVTNQTPANMGSGMNQTPTDLAPETNQNQMNMTPDMNQNQGGTANDQCVMQPATDRAIALNNRMRMVWEQHVYWTRMLINSMIAGMEDQAAVTARLMKNPSDMASIFAEFYPSDVVSALEALLAEHLKIGGELTTEWNAGNMARANALNQQWYENADQIAASLSAANPCYNMEKLQRMLYHHLELLTQEILNRMSRNYQEDIQVFDEVEQGALAMADYLTNGLIMQFSRDFR